MSGDHTPTRAPAGRPTDKTPSGRQNKKKQRFGGLRLVGTHSSPPPLVLRSGLSGVEGYAPDNESNTAYYVFLCVNTHITRSVSSRPERGAFVAVEKGRLVPRAVRGVRTEHAAPQQEKDAVEFPVASPL